MRGAPARGLTLSKSAVIAPPHQGGTDTALLMVAIAALGMLALALVARQRRHAAGTPAAAALIAGLMALPLMLTGRVKGGSGARLEVASSEPVEAVPTPEPDCLQPSDAEAAFTRAAALEREHDLAGAQDAYRHADALGHPEAAFHLGCMLAERADFDAARSLFARADELGHAAGACNVGILLEQENDLAGAEAAYRRGDDRGNGVAAFHLGGLLVERGDLSGAEAAYLRADERGHVAGAFNLGVLREHRGDLDGATSAYLRAEQGGHGALAEQARAALVELARSTNALDYS